MNNRPGACSRVRQCPQEPGRLFHLVQASAQISKLHNTPNTWRRSRCGGRAGTAAFAALVIISHQTTPTAASAIPTSRQRLGVLVAR
ncbi:hypothetical protein, partial [Verrucomicrobium spinosum]|uniref:hypothetical protein n=1 Tax=Verrucomicrobium spinosum TaxID=2736 RepID=UPI001C47ABBE